MKPTLLGLLGLPFLLCACLPDGGGGGGGGAGGGGGTNNFAKGFTFVRKDDRNLYVSDQSDYNTVSALTTGGGVHQPSLSQDGARVVFVLQSGTASEIDVVSATGGTPSTVVSTATQPTLSNLRTPVLSPDGSKVVFAYDMGAGSALAVVNVDGSGLQTLAGGSLSYSSPSFYPDGLSVLAATGSSASNLSQMEKVTLASGQSTNVTSTLGLEAMSVANRVVISPDGTQAAFDGRLSSGASRIFVINLSSQTVHRLTDYPADPTANDTFPCWVGTGEVGFSSDTGGNDQVYQLAATSNLGSGGLVLPSAIEPWFGPN